MWDFTQMRVKHGSAKGWCFSQASKNCRTGTMNTNFFGRCLSQKGSFGPCVVSLPCGNGHEYHQTEYLKLAPISYSQRSVLWCNGTGFQLRCLVIWKQLLIILYRKHRNCPCLDVKLVGHICSLKLTWLTTLLLLIVTVEGGKLLVQIQWGWVGGGKLSSENQI